MPRRRDVVHQARITWPGSRVASSPMDDPKTFFPLPICIQVYTYISELGCTRVTRSSCQGGGGALRKRPGSVGFPVTSPFSRKFPPNISPPLVRLDSYCGMTPLSHEKLSDLTYSPPWRMGTDRRHGPKDVIDGITYAYVVIRLLPVWPAGPIKPPGDMAHTRMAGTYLSIRVARCPSSLDFKLGGV